MLRKQVKHKDGFQMMIMIRIKCKSFAFTLDIIGKSIYNLNANHLQIEVWRCIMNQSELSRAYRYLKCKNRKTRKRALKIVQESKRRKRGIA